MMFKKILFILTSCLFFSTGFAEDIWTITDIKPWRNTFLLTMDNGTVWRFKKDPGKTKYHSVYHSCTDGGSYSDIPYYVPGRSSDNINYFRKGDPIIPFFFERFTLIFKDIQGENPIGCILQEYLSNALPSIYEMDSNGYSIIMSDGHEWTFSWSQAWTSYHWEIGDTLLPMTLRYHSKEIVNLDRLLRRQDSCSAYPRR